MFCSHCGKEIKEGMKFCPGCGAPLNTLKQNTPETPVKITPARQKENEKQTYRVTKSKKESPLKGKLLWILGGIEIWLGFSLLVAAQITIYDNPHYTWRRPYTSFESETILLKWIGIALLIFGIIDIALKIVQTRYKNNHIQEMSDSGGHAYSKVCPGCGLSVSSDLTKCPRCGTVLDSVNNYRRQNENNY